MIARDGDDPRRGLARRLRRRRTPRSRRSPPAATPTSPARRSTSRSSRAATTGKTPPCTDAIARPGIARVVVASDDPTEKASGRGLGILRDEGVEVDVADGELAARARLVNQAFRKHARTGRPWVLFKSAMTLDGKVATRTGDSKWISGESSRARAHRWRAAVDAVAVGIGTALADDPQLTARVDGVARQPRRVVFDSDGAPAARLAARRAARRDPADRRRLARRAAQRDRRARDGRRRGDRRHRARTSPRASLARSTSSASSACTSLLLEGGPHLAGAFFDAGEIDEVRLFLAPLLLGGRSARDPLEGEGVEQIADALRALTLECEQVGEDLLITARLQGVVSVFTGLVEDLGEVAAVDATADGARLSVDAARRRAGRGRLDRRQRRLPDRRRRSGGALRRRRDAGDAAALVARRAERGRRVNLELALRAGDRLGGHIVQGHVDGIGAVGESREEASPAS